MDYKVGEIYRVNCAAIRLNEDGSIFYIPVFDHLHADPQFGFAHQHYHIDGRFAIHPRISHYFNLRDGYTCSVILPHGADNYKFISFTVQYLECVRLTTGLDLTDPENLKSFITYEQWYKNFMGKKCTGKTCPHFGTEMLQRDGVLVCPMHQLTADAKTLRIIERKILV